MKSFQTEERSLFVHGDINQKRAILQRALQQKKKLVASFEIQFEKIEGTDVMGYFCPEENEIHRNAPDALSHFRRGRRRDRTLSGEFRCGFVVASCFFCPTPSGQNPFSHRALEPLGAGTLRSGRGSRAYL